MNSRFAPCANLPGRCGSREVMVEHMNPCVGLLVVGLLVSVRVLFATTCARVAEARLSAV